jgi:hypothetical protein
MQDCPRRWPAVWLSACSAALVLAGCGGGRNSAPPPKLPASLAHSLAATSDDVAARLASGDACGAATAARELQQRAIASTATVPAELQESLQSAVNDLADRTGTACAAAAPPAPPAVVPPPATAPPDKGKGHGHGKGHKKKHGDEGGGD